MFDILEPQECSVSGFTMEPADDTRRALAEIIPEVKEEQEESVPSKEQLKLWRDAGKTAFADALKRSLDYQASDAPRPCRAKVELVTLLSDYPHKLVALGAEDVPQEDVLRILYFVGVINWAVYVQDDSASPYVYEGIFSAAKAYAYKEGIKFDTKWTRLLLIGAASAPLSTSAWMDQLVSWSTFTGTSHGFLYTMRDRSEGILQNYGRRTANHEGILYSLEGLVSTEGTDAMFHGFMGIDNLAQLRWQNMRAGAAVKSVTGSDDTARHAADILRNVKRYTYKLYPNDIPFGDIYRDFANCDKSEGIDSCMSGGAGQFDDVPYGVHPCDAYSAAHFGAGDNGLVLVVAYQGDIAVGRGIMNVDREEIVRWYGKHAARVQFTNLTGVEEESGCLDGSWLVLLSEDGKFAHPYLDGDNEWGEVDTDAGRVNLFTGNIDLQNTHGWSYCGGTQRCEIDGKRYAEEVMEYQSESDTWVHPENKDNSEAVVCAVTGEYFNRYNTHTRTIDCDEARVYDNVSSRIMETCGYEWLNDTIGWTQDTSQYRYDDVTEEWYTEDDYNAMLAEREEQDSDEDTNADAA